jgi:hypothetical protein
MFLTVAVVAIGFVIVARPGPEAPRRPSTPPVVTAGPSVAIVVPSGSPVEGTPMSPEPIALDPIESPEPPAGPCSTGSMIREFAPLSLAAIARSSKAVVLVTVLEVGAAQWNTPDRRAPAHPHPDPTDVIRLARVRVDELLAGGLASDVVAFSGGTVGCWSFLMDETPSELRPGDRYVLIIREGGLEAFLPGVMLVSRTWTFAGGRVAAPLAGPMTLAEFRAQIREPASLAP